VAPRTARYQIDVECTSGPLQDAAPGVVRSGHRGSSTSVAQATHCCHPVAVSMIAAGHLPPRPAGRWSASRGRRAPRPYLFRGTDGITRSRLLASAPRVRHPRAARSAHRAGSRLVRWAAVTAGLIIRACQALSRPRLAPPSSAAPSPRSPRSRQPCCETPEPGGRARRCGRPGS
jgi:hypothetical protein